MTWRGDTTPMNRVFACLPYLLPLIEGLAFGSFFFRDFPAFQVALLPLAPVLQIYSSIPFAGLVIFFALFLGVVRNERVPHFIRFNAMQAILLDIILVLCSIVFSILLVPLGVPILIATLSNVVFFGTLAAIFYSVAQCVMGRYAEIPTLSDAVYMQVR